MNLTFVTTHLSVFNGAGKFLMDYANKFSEVGHLVTIIAQKIDKNNYFLDKKIIIIELGDLLPKNPLFWVKFKKIKENYLKILRKIDYDLLISLQFPANYFCSELKNHPNKKHIYYCFEPFRFLHDKNYYSSSSFYYEIMSFFLRILFKKYDIKGSQDADEIISISKFTMNKIKRIYNRDSYLHYIGTRIDNNLLNSNNSKFLEKLDFLKKDNALLLNLGLTHYMKGAEELIIIFNKILKNVPNAILVIGGSIRKVNKIKIEKLIKKFQIEHNKIIFSGFIKQDLLDFCYKQATLTLYTAKDEAYGLIPLESMKNGTPVIAFEGGPSETIIDNKTGFIIKKDDINSFAKNALKLIYDKKLHEYFSKNARIHVKENFSFEKSFKILENIFNKISQK